jgi:hypothetical protein
MTADQKPDHTQRATASSVNWLARSMEDRFAEVERLRLEAACFAGTPDAEPRMSKVVTIVRQRPRNSR